MAFDNLKRELQVYGKLYSDKLKQKLKQDDNYATGKLDKSIKPTQVDVVGEDVEISLMADRYIGAISKGRRAGRIPPSTSILEWAKAKGIKPEKGGMSDSNMKRMSFAIARSIGIHGMLKEYGFKGTGIIDFVYKSLADKMGKDLFNAYKKDIEEQLKKQVKTN